MAISTMIFTSGYNDVLRMHRQTQDDGIAFRLAYIRSDFDAPLREPFDQVYMRALFRHGYDRARAGFDWAEEPPLAGRPAPRAG